MTPRAAVVAGVVVFVTALVVRVAMMNTARFGGDEALFFRIGMDIVEAKGFPLLGTQITDGDARLPGPAFLYVMALPLLVWRAPEAQYLFVEVAGAVTVVVFWLSLRRPFGERAAFITGMLVACSPWSALYADRTWNPNVLPLVVVVAFFAALRLRDDPRSRWGIAFVPLLAVMPQFHMAAPVAWAGLVPLAGMSLRHLPRRHILMGLGLSALLYLPLAVNELTTGFSNTQKIFAETLGHQGGEHHPWGFVWVPVYALRFLTLDVTYQELTGYWGGPDEFKCLHALLDGTAARPFHPLRFFALVVSGVVAASALVVVVKDAVIARRVSFFGAAFVAALAANTALMGLAQKQVFGHYVILLQPFVAVAWAALFARARGRVFVGFAVAAAIVCVGGVEATWSVSNNVDAKIGLAVHRAVTKVIVDDATAAGVPQTEPVFLSFRGVRSSWFDWHIFATRAVSVPLHFDAGAKTRRYALSPDANKRPRDAIGDAVDVEHAVLWRLAPLVPR